jgi:phosphohistidine phosphatase
MLTLMRHGEASWASATDEQRELTEQGIAFVNEQAKQYANRLAPVTRIIASPFYRTRQTADLVAAHMSTLHANSGAKATGAIEIILDDRLTPDTPIPDAVAALEQYWKPELLVVTHQPLIGLLTSYLLQGSILYPEPFLPGQLISMDMEWPGAAQGIRIPH